MKLKAGGKAVLILAIVGAAGFGISKMMDAGYFNPKTTVASSVPDKIDIPGQGSVSSADARTFSSSKITIDAAGGSGQLRVLTIPWNATMGLHYANGGVTTSGGSLMAKHGLKVVLERQDDYAQMLAEQVKFAQQVANGVKQPTEGAAFVVIMGDGYPAYIAGAQETLSKLGQQLEVVGALGYSRGEDKCMLPPEVKADPQKARGSLVGAVLRDGDWNICVKFASDNGVPINPNEKTYDPDAMNFVSVDAFTKADDNYIAGYCESRQVVKGGKPTGEARKVCQNGTATWTPGDVKIAQQKGGIVAVASTKEYRWQMPATVIGNKQWMSQNRAVVDNFLAAAFEGGEAVRTNDAALTKGAEVSAAVYKEESPEYWKKYFKGVVETDKTGRQVSLGGSSANGLGDNAFLFGLNGNDNLYKRVYTVFGNIAVKNYPDVMPKLVKYEDVVNTSYIQDLLNKSTSVGAVDKPTYVENSTVTGTFAKKAVSVEFESGKATFTGSALGQLNDIANQLAIASNEIQINGHTDNVGNATANLTLSKARAEAVRAWLAANAPSNFPTERFRTRGFGDTAPVADNTTQAGKAKNRRVEIILLSN